jgi:hypothetical protein
MLLSLTLQQPLQGLQGSLPVNEGLVVASTESSSPRRGFEKEKNWSFDDNCRDLFGVTTVVWDINLIFFLVQS